LKSPLGHEPRGLFVTTLGAITQYGLIDRNKGEGISVSQLAIRLIHPVNDAQLVSDRRESATRPRVFVELITGGFQHCSEEVLTNHLIQQGFTQDGAKRAASVFKANVEFAKLDGAELNLDREQQLTQIEQVEETPQALTTKAVDNSNQSPRRESIIDISDKNMLATYLIPLGSNEATLTFTGSKLSADDFDALGEFIAFAKKQFERKAIQEKLKDISTPTDRQEAFEVTKI